MRFYSNFKDANSEIIRDVAELGKHVHPQTMQDKQIADDPDYGTIEYTNMIYTVTKPDVTDLSPTQPWSDAEFSERIAGVAPGDGEAWKLRPEIWEEFAARGFGYTYGERYADSLDRIIAEIATHSESRQLFLSVWNPLVDTYRLGKVRVPCSLGYWFIKREGQLHVTYLQRSADIATHLQNDQYLTRRLQEYIADRTGVDAGRFAHWIGSCHVYAKDVAGVF